MISKVYTTQEIKVKELLTGPAIFDIEGDWALISIYHNPDQPVIKNDGDVKTLRHKKCKKILSICFGDYTDKDLMDFSGKYKTASKHINIITHVQACSIVEFIKHLKEFDNIKTLIVQCKMGISRSGAVGLYAVRLFNLDEDEYMKSTSVIPNYFIYKMLSDVHNPIPLLQEEDL